MSARCPGCGCLQADARSLATHAVIDALAGDDLDRAIQSDLLAEIHCDACAPACQAGLRAARTQRLDALAARERHRAREARLQARARERAARRGGPATGTRAGPTTTARPEARPPLPPAAAAALARAKARAAERGQR